jgi:hypothetical protein
MALLSGAASPVLAAAAYVPCADFISSRIDDVPVAGELMGWAEVTVTWYVDGEPYRTEKHYEGYYRTDSGTIRVDCETYRQIA